MMHQADHPPQPSSQPMDDPRFERFAAKMQAAGVPPLAIRIFHFYYQQLLAGATGYISQDEAAPVDTLPDYTDLGDRQAEIGQKALERAVVLKLNGGLGTSMGMDGPKCLLPVKGELTFLDIIVKQVLHLRKQTGVRLPLVLMNSFNTVEETREALQRYPELEQDIPLDFLQHKLPKIWKESLLPAEWPADPEKEWCPPGHGNIYVALLTSGMLEKMLDAGYEYAFVSNSDNLGAVLDTRILGHFVEQRLPFLMEVAYRTAADVKGGHLARRPDGRLILREISQCPPEEQAAFQDIERYRYFNTNNLWIHLPTLREVLQRHDDMLQLPLIRNEKPVDPTDLDSPRVYQLETAMGSAIALFEGAEALRVPRSRFIPVKKTNDLLVLWSDVYELTDGYLLRLTPDRPPEAARRPPLVFLDDRYYMLIADLQERFPHGAPSMRRCLELRVDGNIYFGRDVVVEGKVHLKHEGNEPLHIADGTVLGPETTPFAPSL